MAERAELEADARQTAPGHRLTNGTAVEVAAATGAHEALGPRMPGRAGMHPRQVLAMQRLAGNRAVADALGSNRAVGMAENEEAETATDTTTAGEVAVGALGGMAAAAGAAGESSNTGGSASGGNESAQALPAAGTAAAIMGSEAFGATAGPGGQSGAGVAGAEEIAAGQAGVGATTGAMAGMAGAAGQAGAGGGGAGAIAGMAEQAGAAGGSAAGMAGAAGQAGAATGGAGAIAGMAEQAGAAGGGAAGMAGATGGSAGVGAGAIAGMAEQAGAAGGGAAGVGGAVGQAGAATGGAGAVAGMAEQAGAAAGGAAGASAGATGHGGPSAESGGAGQRAHAAGAGAGAEPSSHEGGGEAGPGEESASSGGGGLDVDGPAPHGEPFPDPTVPAAPAPGEINRLGEAAPEVETGEEPTAEEEGDAQSEDVPEGEIMGHVDGVAAAGNDAGDGGIVDALLNQAKAAFRGVVGTVTGAARAVAGTVTGAVRAAVRGATNLVRGVVNGIVATAQSIKNSVLSGIRSVVGEITSAARSVVSRVLGAVRNAMGSVRTAVMAAIGRALRGESLVPAMLAPVIGFLQRLFGDIPGQITGLITRLTQTVNGYIDRLIAGVVALTATIAGSIASIASTLQGAVASVAATITGLAQQASSLVGGLPGVLRSAIGWLVDGLLTAVRAAVRAIQDIVNGIINSVSARLQAMVARLATRVINFINGIRNSIRAVADLVMNLIRAGLARLAAFRDWLVRGAMAMLGRVLRTVVEPLKNALMGLLMQRLGPQIQAAMATARTMFPNGLPSPPEVIAAQAQAATQVAAQAQEAIVNGLLHPEGDHFSIGFQLGGDISGGAGVSAGAGASLEVVMDYRRGDIGFFVSPGASAQLSVGDIGATGALSGSMTWGTVGSFGDAKKDVLQGWGGWFTNASYGAQAGLAEGGGLAVQSGGVISVGGSTDFGTIGSYVPAGADQHLVPGATVQGPPIPGTPDAHDVVALGEVLFPTQSADVNALGGGSVISGAASTANSYPTGHDGARVISIDVTGEASRAWRHPGASSREDSNRDLAARRAEAVRTRLEPQVPGISVRGIGASDSAAARAGKAETDASPEDQRATMFGSVFKTGTPDQPGQTTQQPGQLQGDPFQVNAGVPNPLAAGRSAWGWDTSVGVAGLVGEGGKAGVYGGLGASYSFPIGKTHFDATTMAMTRIIFGLIKMLGDVETGSPLGLIRDAIGMGWGVEELVTSSFGQAVGDWTIPMPTGIAVA